MNHEMKIAIWRSMLDADMSARYWKYLAHRYMARDKRLRIGLAALATGTVGVWFKWEEVALLWKTLSSASAIIAITLPYLDYPRKIEDMSALAGAWGKLRMDYEDLWSKVGKNSDWPLLEEDYRRLRETEALLQEKEVNLPNKGALLKECQNEVKKARGLG
uniref:SMODS and SLOG-associating 2TM effector domain-containing protein n=1 Tax=Candidatus Kentrum sp. MB TaxID=2138164 RepID=A0A451BAK9_9GAMM|nr:MAG: hypothetical protein BECKMB1821G_GA0114241_100856 [Candidatus Kentron sp. MB]VFK30717.1 MAG: hypothetical protein BECKMB1821I_GA0114274_101731 [Candidatus Kentron sp. MB]VFK75336.1 MAG: hypothetical protein BECKMB1821H_GA0114242_102011 [Candidatus Kentron sp. MB]